MTDATTAGPRRPPAEELRRGAGRALLSRALSDGGAEASVSAQLSLSRDKAAGDAAEPSVRLAEDVVAAPASEPPRLSMVERLRKRGRVESASYEPRRATGRARGATTAAGARGFRGGASHGRPPPLERAMRKCGLPERASSSPDLGAEVGAAWSLLWRLLGLTRVRGRPTTPRS